MSVSWIIEERAGRAPRARLSGRITEEATFDELIELGRASGITLNLAHVEQINSCGVREWILFMRRLEDAAGPLILEQCSPAIVRQLNMISNFAGRATVSSVLLPYYCEDCGAEENVAIDVAAAGNGIVETRPCASCGSVAEFDDLPDTYLSFADLVA